MYTQLDSRPYARSPYFRDLVLIILLPNLIFVALRT